MRNYEFHLFVDGGLSGQDYGFGENAISAFETAVEQGSCYFPEGERVLIVAINEQSGLAIKFEVYRGGLIDEMQ